MSNQPNKEREEAWQNWTKANPFYKDGLVGERSYFYAGFDAGQQSLKAELDDWKQLTPEDCGLAVDALKTELAQERQRYEELASTGKQLFRDHILLGKEQKELHQRYEALKTVVEEFLAIHNNYLERHDEYLSGGDDKEYLSAISRLRQAIEKETPCKSAT